MDRHVVVENATPKRKRKKHYDDGLYEVYVILKTKQPPLIYNIRAYVVDMNMLKTQTNVYIVKKQ